VWTVTGAARTARERPASFVRRLTPKVVLVEAPATALRGIAARRVFCGAWGVRSASDDGCSVGDRCRGGRQSGQCPGCRRPSVSPSGIAYPNCAICSRRCPTCWRQLTRCRTSGCPASPVHRPPRSEARTSQPDAADSAPSESDARWL